MLVIINVKFELSQLLKVRQAQGPSTCWVIFKYTDLHFGQVNLANLRITGLQHLRTNWDTGMLLLNEL